MGFWARKVRELAEDFGLYKPESETPEYMTQKEAASYCCVSVRQFRKIAPTVGLLPFMFGGKLVYRREDLKKAMEDARWQASM